MVMFNFEEIFLKMHIDIWKQRNGSLDIIDWLGMEYLLHHKQGWFRNWQGQIDFFLLSSSPDLREEFPQIPGINDARLHMMADTWHCLQVPSSTMSNADQSIVVKKKQKHKMSTKPNASTIFNVFTIGLFFSRRSNCEREWLFFITNKQECCCQRKTWLWEPDLAGGGKTLPVIVGWGKI